MFWVTDNTYEGKLPQKETAKCWKQRFCKNFEETQHIVIITIHKTFFSINFRYKTKSKNKTPLLTVLWVFVQSVLFAKTIITLTWSETWNKSLF